MIDLHLVGIGTGNPDHLTRAAIDTLNRADLILLPRKGRDKADLADLRRSICRTVLRQPVPIAEFDMPVRETRGHYLESVRDWHEAIATTWAHEIETHRPQGGRVALLVWGDPSLYDSTLRIAGTLKAAGLPLRCHVVPGITSLQALTAAHAIPLNTLGGAVWITTGRRLREEGWPAGADSVAVMLDSGGSFTTLAPEGLHIWWGAYLGMPQETLIEGPLAKVSERILAERARLRALHGWIMDVSLLRRSRS